MRESYRAEQDNLRLRQTDLFTLTKSDKTLDVRLVCRADRCSRYNKKFDAILKSVRLTS